MIIKIHWCLIIFIVYLIFINGLKYFFLFYVFVIIHELAHILLAKILNIKIKEIVFLSVGVNAQYENTNINKEFWVACAGPIASFFLAIFFENSIYSAINTVILITNIMPIYPLDGGRIIRILIIKIFGYKKGVNLYGTILKYLICLLTIVTVICTVYFKNYFMLIFMLYIFILANREIKKEKIKLLINELIGIHL